MADNVMFKRGKHSALATAEVVNGAFYLTTDTGRLFVGQDGSLVELNKSITSVSETANLPVTGVAEGQYYYAIKENILAYYNGIKWVQINPDATLEITSANITVKQDDDGEGATVTDTITDSEGHASTGSFHIEGNDAVTVTSPANSNNVIIDAHDTHYKLGTSTTAGEINMVPIKKVSGNWIEDTDQPDAKLPFTVTGKKNDGATVVVTNKADGSGIELEVNTINTGVGNFKAAFGSSSSTTDGVDGKDLEAGKLQIGIYNDTSSWQTTEVKPIIRYGENGDQEAIFDGGIATINTYSKEEIQSLFTTADAMNFKGVVGKTGPSDNPVYKDLPSIDIAQNGDTYKVGSFDPKSTTDQKNLPTLIASGAKPGDLFIAHGDDKGGTLSVDPNAEWVLVPSGNDQTISSSTIIGQNKYGITDQSEVIADIKFGTTNENMSVTMGGDSQHATLDISHTGPGQSGEDQKVDKTGGNVVASEGQQSLKLVTAVDTDANGHIRSYDLTEYTFNNTHNHITSHDITLSGGATEDATSGSVKVTHQITSDDDGTKEDSFNIDSQTLRVKQANDNISIDLVWGTF